MNGDRPCAGLIVRDRGDACARHRRPSRAQTLNEALASAYLNNPTLRAAQAELRRVDEQVPQARAGWRPQAEVTTGGGGALSEGSSQRSNLSSREGPVFALDLRVRQPIYNYGTPASIEEAENAVRAERARLTAAEQDVLLHAAAAYADVLRAQDVLDLNRKHEQLIEQDLESARRRSSAGELAKSNVAQSEASVARATAERARAEAELAAAREVYRVWIGDLPGTLVEPDPPPNLPVTQEEVEGQSSASPNVVADDFAVKEAGNAVDVSRGQKLPQVFLQGDVEASSQSILALLSVPLYNGTLDPQIRAAKSSPSNAASKPTPSISPLGRLPSVRGRGSSRRALRSPPTKRRSARQRPPRGASVMNRRSAYARSRTC